MRWADGEKLPKTGPGPAAVVTRMQAALAWDRRRQKRQRQGRGRDSSRDHGSRASESNGSSCRNCSASTAACVFRAGGAESHLMMMPLGR